MNILILCTGNSARSILGEAIFSKINPNVINAFSAGSDPKDHPHPMAIETLRRYGHDTRRYSSKHWDAFADPEGPQMDVVITVCDSAANESCPIWPGAPVQVHWGLPDPAVITDETLAFEAFQNTYAALQSRAEAAFKQGLLEASPPQRRQILIDVHASHA
jgi:protein-tyrosine-phosphatase